MGCDVCDERGDGSYVVKDVKEGSRNDDSTFMSLIIQGQNIQCKCGRQKFVNLVDF